MNPKFTRFRPAGAPAPWLRTMLLAGLLTLSSGCGDGVDEARIPPPVILISLDTVRADTLSCYGGPEGATPRLDEFAAGAARFERCVSSAPWTLPSHASMFTGLYPLEHGAHTFLPGAGHQGDNVFALHPRFETLAEALGARGYATAGIVANSIYLRPGLGLEAGFQTWDVRRQSGAKVTDRALAWLDETAPEDGAPARPRFLFINYLDAHRPYATGDPNDRPRAELDELIAQVMVRGEEPGELGERVQGLHQKAVSHLDAEIGRLLEGLKERGLFEPAIIVITSDHGEAFGAHGTVEHSKDVYEDLVRVPLMVKGPLQKVGSTPGEPASSVDVPGLIASHLAGTDAESASDLFSRVPGSHLVLSENHFSRLGDLVRYGDRFRRERRAIYDGDLKLIIDSSGRHELYNLALDPDEMDNLMLKDAAGFKRLIGADAAFAERNRFRGEPALPGQLTELERAELGVLGYGPTKDDPVRPSTK